MQIRTINIECTEYGVRRKMERMADWLAGAEVRHSSAFDKSGGGDWCAMRESPPPKPELEAVAGGHNVIRAGKHQ